MTANKLLASLLPLVDDLSRHLDETERFRRLLAAVRDLVPCDAVALLRLEEGVLVPQAVEGLSADSLGRRFRVSEHPRLEALLQGPGVTRFASDCTLPDPYDGLIPGDAVLEVHDCMGCPLHIDDKPWGLLTLDALQAEQFSTQDQENLEVFSFLVAATVKTAAQFEQLRSRAEAERHDAERFREAANLARAPELVGQSAAHRRLQEEVTLVAGSDLTVLVTGETGVGKELVAQAIHERSARARRPLISINCAALPDALVESELFGHVRGAFSGAVSERRGKFELADGGTLFLDEVGEMALSTQAKLLRVLQSGQLQRLGSDHEHLVDVRIIAATNRDLAAEVKAGRFRADLYHRLSVYPLRVPALRERGRDALLLAGFFLEQNRMRLGVRSLRLDAAAQAALLTYHWPGNVRELEHLIGRAALKALARQESRPRVLSIETVDLDLPGPTSMPLPAAAGQWGDDAAAAVTGDLRLAVDDFQRRVIVAALQRQQDNWAAVARELGMDRANLHRLASRLGLKG